MLNGKKTYIVSAVMILMGAAGAITGVIDQGEASRLLIEGLAFATLRAGVAKGSANAG